LAKIRVILEQTDDCIVQDRLPDDEPPIPVNSKELKQRISRINAKNSKKDLSKEEKKEFTESLKTMATKYSVRVSKNVTGNCSRWKLPNRVTAVKKITGIQRIMLFRYL
jgi:ribosomal protein S25